MASKNAKKNNYTFNNQLILFRYFLSLFGKQNLNELAGKLNNPDYEGVNENQNTYFLDYLCINAGNKLKISIDKLKQYDENICRYVKHIGEKRNGLTLKYYQYISLLFTEIYLDYYFNNRDEFINDLNNYIDKVCLESKGIVNFKHVSEKDINKLAFMCATGSGKTLIMHINILQFMHYFTKAQRNNSSLQINKIIILSPNETMSHQHLDELKLSSIPAEIFQKDMFSANIKSNVVIIDMNKLKEEGKIKTVSIDSFEQNNLVLVDEAHRGLNGDVWYDYRNRLSNNGGFSFEYSATFKQSLQTINQSRDGNKDIYEEYCKSIIMDYSYRYFYNDGYGKEYRIYNLKAEIDKEQKYLYLVGCLLSFYQQIKLYELYKQEFSDFHIEKPLLVFVGNRVTATTAKAELTDIEEIIQFIDDFVNKKSRSINAIKSVIEEDTGLMDSYGKELFSENFNGIKYILDTNSPDPGFIYQDILRIVFNSDTISDSPRLHLENIKQVNGEIALRIGNDGNYFGVISIGDSSSLIKNCELKKIVSKTEEFVTESLFRSINNKNSNINILIGSRKFAEGWNSWRVSTMGLINFAKGEGSQAIQLFGRGVRLHGYNKCLKRSNKIYNLPVAIPEYFYLLETLTIFGVKAQYMEDFKSFLEIENLHINTNIYEYKIPVVNRFPLVKDRHLKILKVKDGISFRKQSKGIILDIPDKSFFDYLVKNKISIDCRSKVQTFESEASISSLKSETEKNYLNLKYLPLLNYDRMFEELVQYKNEKLYHNIIIQKDKLIEILSNNDWYSFIIPKAHLEIDVYEKIESVTDFCIIVLKSYLDKFYKFEKSKWEADLIEYKEIEENDNNFVKEYSIRYYAPEQGAKSCIDELNNFTNAVSMFLKKYNKIPNYSVNSFSKSLIAFDFEKHLYSPLIAFKPNGMDLQITPVSLNSGEKEFVDLLKEYIDTNVDLFKDKFVYLIRNKSKDGIGFFEAGNFYPDYILWIDTIEVQYITFIDPKGLLYFNSTDPKIEFYKTIKNIETKLSGTYNGKTIVLNSFIMSSTNSADLEAWWQMKKPQREAKHVLCLDNDDCIDVMIKKILFSI